LPGKPESGVIGRLESVDRESAVDDTDRGIVQA